ncbi:MAG TPA: ATP-binding protein [Vicinamibacterales bacterium]|nr:ATP-binding protein [Vicinamibacterales bacterium]
MDELRLTAKLEVLSSIGAFVLKAAENAGLDRRAAYRLRLAVDEMATNVIVHGNPLEHSGDDEIRLTSEMNDQGLMITLEDRGPEFNPLEHETPEGHIDKPMEQRPIGGLGVFLAIRGVDRFLYERVGDRNRSTFIVNRGAPAENRS